MTTPLLLLFGVAFLLSYAHAGTGDDELSVRIDCFENMVNTVLEGKEQKAQLTPFFMDDSDLEYWMGQFEFTQEVLKEISPEAFYNRLEGWAGTAQLNFLSALEGADRFEVADHQFRTDPDPELRVNQLANLLVYVYNGPHVIGSLRLTLIDVRGQFKLIQAE